jgi:hypothetical protein
MYGHGHCEEGVFCPAKQPPGMLGDCFGLEEHPPSQWQFVCLRKNVITLASGCAGRINSQLQEREACLRRLKASPELPFLSKP